MDVVKIGTGVKTGALLKIGVESGVGASTEVKVSIRAEVGNGFGIGIMGGVKTGVRVKRSAGVRPRNEVLAGA